MLGRGGMSGMGLMSGYLDEGNYEYEEEVSEPLIEEVDDTYEPTEKDIRDYARDKLGMKLPEDENWLYLAREALRAPLPPNWIPFQSRDGQIYYKHKITQEKTLDHPTDTEYLAKFQQLKESMARKNLKSMSLAQKKTQLSLSAQGSRPGSLNEGFEDKLQDRKLLELDLQFDNKLDQLETELAQQFRDFQRSEEDRFQKTLKKSKDSFEEELAQIRDSAKRSSGTKLVSDLDRKKAKLREELLEKFSSELTHHLDFLKKEHQQKMQEYENVYLEDTRIKTSNYLLQAQSAFESIRLRLLSKIDESNRKKALLQQQQTAELQIFHQKLLHQSSPEIEHAEAQELEASIRAINDSFKQKLALEKTQLEEEFQTVKRMLGKDPMHQLQEAAKKRQCLGDIFRQKLEALKAKELLAINRDLEQEFSQEQKKLKKEWEEAFRVKYEGERKECEKWFKEEEEGFQKQIAVRRNMMQEQVQERNKVRMAQYEQETNRKISNIREEAIRAVEVTAKDIPEQSTQRLQLEQKNKQISNKHLLLETLNQHLDLENRNLKVLQLIKLIGETPAADREGLLMREIKAHGLNYRSEIYLRHFEIVKRLQAKYRADKAALHQVMNHLQKNAGMGFIQRAKHPESSEQITAASSALIRKYNEDVRTCRKNEQMIQNYQMILKRAESSDPDALKLLAELETKEGREDKGANSRFTYSELVLINDVGTFAADSDLLTQLTTANRVVPKQTPAATNMSALLDNHSKFLQKVRKELNQKLYEVRRYRFKH